MAAVRMDPDWLENVLTANDAFFGGTLGPQIRQDAYDYCPKRTEDLANSINDYVEDHVLIVEATGSDERWYAAWVELGHRVFHPSTRIVGPERVAPEPFLRPALFQVRSA
jgi:hypothetical protein